jgi:hypothetical protein
VTRKFVGVFVRFSCRRFNARGLYGTKKVKIPAQEWYDNTKKSGNSLYVATDRQDF